MRPFDPDDPRDARAVRAFLAELEVTHQRDCERDALGWIVVCVDLETGELVNASGPFDEPEAAVIHAVERKAEGEKLLDPGDEGWRYDVLPLFAP